MSRYSTNYNDYLGARRCCDSNLAKGPQGAIGAPGDPGLSTDIPIFMLYDGKVKMYAVSEVDENGKFNVYGENGRFNWKVIGKRADIIVEPLKS
jgi:hypothetical protein